MLWAIVLVCYVGEELWEGGVREPGSWHPGSHCHQADDQHCRGPLRWPTWRPVDMAHSKKKVEHKIIEEVYREHWL